MITGPTIFTPITLTFGTPPRAHSASKIQRCAAVQSGPPYSTGHPGAPQPFLCSVLCQAMPMSGSENTDGVSAVARLISGVRFPVMKPRTSCSKARSSALKVRSMSHSLGLNAAPAQGGVAAIMMSAAAEQRVEGQQPLEVGTDVELFGDAHGAMQLDRLLGDEARAFADFCFGARRGTASRDGFGVGHQRRGYSAQAGFV